MFLPQIDSRDTKILLIKKLQACYHRLSSIECSISTPTCSDGHKNLCIQQQSIGNNKRSSDPQKQVATKVLYIS